METVAIFHKVPKFLVARNSNSKIPRWIKVAPSPMISGENTILQLNAREWKVNRPTNQPTDQDSWTSLSWIYSPVKSVFDMIRGMKFINANIHRGPDNLIVPDKSINRSMLLPPRDILSIPIEISPPQPFPQQFLWPFDKKIALRLLLIRLSFLDNSFLVSQ